MSLYYNKQSQFELFPAAASRPYETKKGTGFFISSLTLPLETMMVASIFLIMLMVVMFSLGVERGKKIAMGTRAVRAKAVPSAPAPAPAQAGTAVVPAAAPAAVPSNNLPAPHKETVENDGPGGYTIQVASYAQESAAQREAGNLNKKGYKTLVMNKGKFTILCVGKFGEKSEAQSFSKELRKKYRDCLVRSL